MPHRVHVFGASGSGTTTLGAAVASVLGVPFLDTAAYDWVATDPPFTTKRPPVRSLDLHERWMARLPCPVLRLDARQPGEALREAVVARLGR